MHLLDARQRAALPAVRFWLYFTAFLIFCMVIVGGATRLTDSGLSITEWQPLLGAIPPLTEAALAGGLREVPADPRVSADQQGHVASKTSSSSTGGSGRTAFLAASSGWPSSFPLPIFALTGRLIARNGLALRRAVRAGRAAGRAGLVHGVLRPGRPGRRQPIPAFGPPDAGHRDLRRNPLGGHRPRRQAPCTTARDGMGRTCARRAHPAAGRGRRLRRGPRCRHGLQHLAADGRRPRAAGAVRSWSRAGATCSRMR